jgi:hypothetical protein
VRARAAEPRRGASRRARARDRLVADRDRAAARQRGSQRRGARGGDPAALLARAPFDLVLAADVLYERRSVPVLSDLLPRLGGEVLLADPGRPPLEAFLERFGPVWARPPVYRLR